ncbi:MAG: methyltransferase type 11 [Desulfobacterales bacterium SG8_35]|nr:MAG: methyltransferase type 11 [Desulfobacterales bacterium SG8_35]
MSYPKYIMESPDEALRLDLKADPEILREQAVWAGIKPGMRAADLGCGPGKTTFYLNKLVQPNGSTVGVDISKQRFDYAQTHYSDSTLEFHLYDIRKPLNHLGLFDFVWLRFVLEHHRENSFDIVKNISSILKPGGIICLADLDFNCLIHYGIPVKLEKALFGVMKLLEEQGNFDPYVGRKFYSFLYDLGFEDIDIYITTHHLIFGELKDIDERNWLYKVEVAAKKSGYSFEEFSGGFKEFKNDFLKFFRNPRRFTYTPIILARGSKP